MNGNVEFVISNGSFATFRAGAFLHDRYTDTGIPQTTNYIYQTPTSSCIGCPIPANLQGSTLTAEYAARQIAAFDTTKRALFNADYNHTFQSAGWHTLKGGFGFQHTINDVNSLYPGGYIDIFWEARTGWRCLARQRFPPTGALLVTMPSTIAASSAGRSRHPVALHSGSVAIAIALR